MNSLNATARSSEFILEAMKRVIPANCGKTSTIFQVEINSVNRRNKNECITY